MDDVTPATPEQNSEGRPRVAGTCPACGHKSLFVASAGYVTCAISECPDPGAVADLLDGKVPEVLRDRGARRLRLLSVYHSDEEQAQHVLEAVFRWA